MPLTKKRMSFLFLIFTCSLLSLSACNRMPKGNAVDGERWFKLNRCNGCHGENGFGGEGPAIAKGPVIAGTTLSFNKFLHKLRKPNSGIMPTFVSKQLSDKDAGEIYLWLLEQKK